MKQFLLLILVFPGVNAFAQQKQNYAHQLALVDSLRSFIVNGLKLDVGNDFYTKWSESNDSMYIMLYVSLSDKVQIPNEIVGRELWHIEGEDSAIAKSAQLQAQGYETLVYKTAGTSGAFISRKLLSYPDEAIAFIVCHEATHRHVRNDKTGLIPYICEEALCDAVANVACMRFAQQTQLLDLKRVLGQKKIFEKIYAFMNDARATLDWSRVEEHASILKACNSSVWKIAGHGNQFVKDRMEYKVNHAYFVRIAPYALHYFEVQQMLGKNIDVNDAIQTILKIFGKEISPPQKKPNEKGPAEIILPPQISIFLQQR